MRGAAGIGLRRDRSRCCALCHHSNTHLMNFHLSLTPLISLVAGVLILIMPKLLNIIVAVYLIAIGLIGIFGASSFHLR